MYDHLPEVQYWLSEMDRKLETMSRRPIQIYTYKDKEARRAKRLVS